MSVGSGKDGVGKTTVSNDLTMDSEAEERECDDENVYGTDRR